MLSLLGFYEILGYQPSFTVNHDQRLVVFQTCLDRRIWVML